jgi:sulfhydrogenase subunit alpha
VGRSAEEAYWITPRICGVCPIAHNLASVKAIESAYGIEVNETTKLLRDLMVCGQMIQSHVLHLFFLVLPDYVGIDRGTELNQKDPKSFAKALALKKLGDEIAYVVAGRNVHPTTTAFGGFHKIPTKEELKNLLDELNKNKEDAAWVPKLFSKFNYPDLKVELELTALEGDDMVTITSTDSDLKKTKISAKEYKQNIEEELRDYSTAKFGSLKGKAMFVGSLARLAVSGETEGYKLNFANPFHNNIAQAIEILKYHKQATEIVNKLLAMETDATLSEKSPTATLKGVGYVEAPRGGLYNEIHLDESGNIVYANIITPTVQNLTSIEKSVTALINSTAGMEQKARERLINMLVRAYDPCITCSVH